MASDEGDDGLQIQVSFSTKLPSEFVVSNLPLALPARLTRLGLSEVINHLLELTQARPFDFLVAGELLRTSLADFAASKGFSAEEVVPVEYTLLPSKPEEQPSIPNDDWVVGLSVLAPSGHILSASYDGKARVWASMGSSQKDAGAGKEALTVLSGHFDAVTCCAWASEGSDATVALTGSKDFSLRSWGIVSKKGSADAKSLSVAPIFQYSGHEGSVQAVAAERATFCSASWDKTLKVWQLPSEAEVANAMSSVGAASSEPKGKKSQKTEAKDASAVKERGCLCTLIGHTQAVTGAAWGREGEVFSGGWDNSVRGWDVETQQCTTSLNAGHAVNGVAVSGNNLIASAHSDRLVRVWDPRQSDGSLVRSSLTSHKGWVNAVAWSRNNEHHLISASHDHTVKLWDVRSSIPLHTLAAHEGKALAVTFGYEGEFYSGGTDGKISCFKLGSELSDQAPAA